LTDQQDHPVDYLPELALGLLGEGDAAPLRAHLATCHECSAEFEEMTRVTALLPLAAEELAPSPALKASLMERIAREPSPSERTGVATAPPANVVPFRARWQWAAVAAAAAAIFLVAGAVGGFALRGGKGDLEETSGRQAQVVQAAADGTLQVARGESAGASAAVVRAPGANVAFLSYQGFPALPAGKAYQAWYTVDGQVFEPSAVFKTGDDGAWLPARGAVDGYAAMGFTIEDEDGAETPSTAPFVVVDLTKSVRVPR